MRLLPAVFSAALLAGVAEAQEDPYAAAGRHAFLAADYATAKHYPDPVLRLGIAGLGQRLEVMFAQGRGSPPLCRQAIRWYERAAKQGRRGATFNLAFMLYNGWGANPDGFTIPYDRARAAPWMERAAALGVPRAQYLIGHMYRTGDGVPISRDEAFAWLERAANAGLPEAQFDLGLMHAGAGNDADAYFWFFLLGLSGYPGASYNADVLAKRLTRYEIYEIVRRAHGWRRTGQ